MRIIDVGPDVGYKYAVESLDSKDRFMIFAEWRKWCWEIWGPGAEIQRIRDWREVHNPEAYDKWCWHTEGYTRIYLKGDEELSAFLLQWQRF